LQYPALQELVAANPGATLADQHWHHRIGALVSQATMMEIYGRLLSKVLQRAIDRMGALAPDDTPNKQERDESPEWLWLRDWQHARQSPPNDRRAFAF
jgi:hypothetical protein